MPYQWKFEKGPKNGANYPAYHRMDIAVRRKMYIGPLETLIYFQMINVLILIHSKRQGLNEYPGGSTKFLSGI